MKSSSGAVKKSSKKASRRVLELAQPRVRPAPRPTWVGSSGRTSNPTWLNKKPTAPRTTTINDSLPVLGLPPKIPTEGKSHPARSSRPSKRVLELAVPRQRPLPAPTDRYSGSGPSAKSGPSERILKLALPRVRAALPPPPPSMTTVKHQPRSSVRVAKTTSPKAPPLLERKTNNYKVSERTRMLAMPRVRNDGPSLREIHQHYDRLDMN